MNRLIFFFAIRNRLRSLIDSVPADREPGGLPLLKQFDFETPPPAFNGKSKFCLRLRGGRRRFTLTPPEHFQL
jgi:hypothetical protein